MIGKYATENGPTHMAKHYTAVWGIQIDKSTAKTLKEKYLEKLKEKITDWQRKLLIVRCTRKNPSLFLNWKQSLEVGQYAWENN